MTKLPALLLDTNIVLEILLQQTHSENCLELLKQIHRGKYLGWCLDFSLYSICLISARKKIPAEKIQKFLRIINSIKHLSILRCPSFWIAQAYTQTEQSNFDFDDALHYCVAKENNFTLVSYDRDFLGQKDIEIKNPQQLI